MRRHLILIAALFAGLSFAGAIKRFAPGQAMSASSVNANFKHLHDTMVGQHGARLVDADVSPDAGITYNKLASHELLTKAWYFCGTGTTTIAGTDCTNTAGSGTNYPVYISLCEASPTAAGADGNYRCYFNTNRPNATYGVIVTATQNDVECEVLSKTVGYFDLFCFVSPGASGSDTGFQLFVMDNYL